MRPRDQHAPKTPFEHKELEPIKDGHFFSLNFLNIYSRTSEIRLRRRESVHHFWGTLKLYRNKKE